MNEAEEPLKPGQADSGALAWLTARINRTTLLVAALVALLGAVLALRTKAVDLWQLFVHDKPASSDETPLRELETLPGTPSEPVAKSDASKLVDELYASTEEERSSAVAALQRLAKAGVDRDVPQLVLAAVRTQVLRAATYREVVLALQNLSARSMTEGCAAVQQVILHGAKLKDDDMVAHEVSILEDRMRWNVPQGDALPKGCETFAR